MQGIDTFDNFEVYIPKEAEVKTIPLRTLPTSVLRRMGVLHSQCSSAKSGSSPLATWISPVVIRERGCSPACYTTDTTKMNLTSLVTREHKDSQGPFLMPFVSSSCVAFRVLGEFLPSTRNIQLCPTQISPLPQGTPPRPQQDAIIINHGRIYLSIKKVKPVRGQGERRSPRLNMSVRASPQTTQGKCIFLSPAKKSLGKHTTDELQETVLLRQFGLTHQVQVTLSRVSPADLEHQSATKQGQSGPVAQNTEQDHDKRELLNGIQSKETPERCFEQVVKKVTRGEDETMNVESEDSAPKTTHLGPLQSKDIQDSVEISGNCGVEKEHNFANVKSGGEEVDEGKCGVEGRADVKATNGDESEKEVQPSDAAEALFDSSACSEASGVNQSIDIECDMQVDADDGTANSVQRWMVELPMVPTLTPTPGQYFDFEQSAREERIDRIRAKLREREAALNNLRPPS